MSDAHSPDADHSGGKGTLRERLDTVGRLGAAMSQRGMTPESAASALHINHEVLGRLLHGCIGGFAMEQLEQFCRTIEARK